MINTSWPFFIQYSAIVIPEKGAIYLSAGISLAVAETIVVYSIAPKLDKVKATWTIEEFFCPIATYIQWTFLPFWLMIVSIPIVVFPVWRSPMINSLWPLPIGNIASIARIPVSNGWSTLLRSITPGAMVSIFSKWSYSIGPLPSIGSLKGLTILPVSPLPTPIETTLCVRLTILSSKMSSYFPNITTPT